VTLDGFFEGAKPWDLDFHNYGWGEELEAMSHQQLEATGALLFGRATYEGMAAFWTNDSTPTADFMNNVPKIVFSNTLERADWTNSRLVRGRAEDEVARLKAQPGKDLYIFGSAALAASLTDAGLIDEYRLGLNPVVLGAGTPHFKPRPAPLPMRLLEARPLKTGCVLLRYAPIK
jgi:dihydrofolate reductase